MNLGPLLVVEPSTIEGELLARVLRRVGHEVTIVSDGLDAIAAVEAWSPRLVLTDLELPGIDGLALIRNLRVRPETRQVPILVVTAVDRVERLAAALDLGADVVLTKPYQGPLLVAQVGRLLRRLDQAVDRSGTAETVLA